MFDKYIGTPKSVLLLSLNKQYFDITVHGIYGLHGISYEILSVIINLRKKF